MFLSHVKIRALIPAEKAFTATQLDARTAVSAHIHAKYLQETP